MGAAWAPLVSTISRWFVRHRGLAVGIGSIGGGTGPFFVAPAVSYWLTEYSWREAYALLGITATALIVGAALLMQRDPTRGALGAESDKGRAVEGLSLAEAMRTAQFWILIVIFGLWWLAGAIVFVQLAPFVLEKGFDFAFAASAVIAFGAGNGTGKIIMGIACDRFGARPVLRLTTGLAALSMFGLGAAESAYGVLVTTFFVGVGFGGGAPQITTLCVDLFGLRSIGSLMGAILALIGVVGAIGPVFSGWMFDVTNSYLLAYWAGGLILIVCVEISFLVSGRQQWAPAAVIPRSEQ